MKEWNSKPISLYANRIDGDHYNVSPENIQLLCANCFAVTANHHARPRFSSRKVTRPTREELSALVWKVPVVQIAKELGVSDKAVEKWCKQYVISKPPRGYWAKLKAGHLP